MPQSRDQAFALLTEYVQTPSLIKHCLGVEACMRWYAKHFGCTPDEIEKWAIAGLLHDFDYEKYPTAEPPDGHPYAGNRILKELGYDEEILEAIMGHAQYSGVPRESLMAKTLFAVDELSGLVTASVLVRPDKSIHTLDVSSVKRKFKDKAFARGCNREDIRVGCEELKIDFDIHIANVISALREAAKELDLEGVK